MTFEEARSALHGAPLGAFVEERKRLARTLRELGDKDGAAHLARLARPSLSAWVVNQLWRRERASFDELFATAARLRAGEPSGTRAHRAALLALRERAEALLEEGGHASSEATLRRVTTTLAALAARGGFGVETEGALAVDLEPPGFEALGAPPDSGAADPPAAGAGRGAGAGGPAGPAANLREQAPSGDDDEQRLQAERASAAAEAKRLAEEARRRRVEAERARLEVEIHVAEEELTRLRRTRDRLRVELDGAEAACLRSEFALSALVAARAATSRDHES